MAARPNIGIVNAAQGLDLPWLPSWGCRSGPCPRLPAVNIWEYNWATRAAHLAGLSRFPARSEAASIDGASSQTFWKVTVPLLRPMLVFVVVTSVIGSFQISKRLPSPRRVGRSNAARS